MANAPSPMSDYIVGETLGSGSYAKVKSARNTKTGQQVALKLINKAKASESFMTKFLPREIKSMRMLDHKNIVKFIDTFESADRVVIVMELVSGGDLLDYVNTYGPIAEMECRRLLRQLCAALAHCHSLGIVHRDLKCENVLLDAKNNVKLSDFGFSTHIKDTSTKLNTNCGSYAYAAPEILSSRSYCGTQTDVWSVGVILFALVFKQLPFNERSTRGLLMQALRPLDFPHTATPTLDLKNLLRRTMCVDAIKRITISEMQTHPWMSALSSSSPHVQDLSSNTSESVPPPRLSRFAMFNSTKPNTDNNADARATNTTDARVTNKPPQAQLPSQSPQAPPSSPSEKPCSRAGVKPDHVLKTGDTVSMAGLLQDIKLRTPPCAMAPITLTLDPASTKTANIKEPIKQAADKSRPSSMRLVKPTLTTISDLRIAMMNKIFAKSPDASFSSVSCKLPPLSAGGRPQTGCDASVDTAYDVQEQLYSVL